MIWVNAPNAREFAWRVGPRYFAGRYSIAYWAWEMPELPEEWDESFRYFDEIWVPTRFVEAAVAPRSRAGVGADAFVFLFAFHFLSIFERKNPLALIEAFTRAFPRRGDAVLVIKITGGAGTLGLAAMHAAARHAGVRIVADPIRPADVDRLMAGCDCYVSLHRSEGFGLTLVEAMTHGKPVIATGYSGNTDFMTGENSYPVGYRLVELERDVGPYRKGWHWAEPDVDHAAALMRHVYEHRDEARRVGAIARADVLRELDPGRIGALARARLETISART